MVIIMNYKVHKSFSTSKIWLVITIFAFSISCIITQVLYYYSDNKSEININAMTAYYILPIILCIISLSFSHFQMLRIGAIFAMLVGVNLITNMAFTNMIINSTKTIITLFEPVFAILPLLGNVFGEAEFLLINSIISIIQVLFGLFLIVINIPVLFKRDNSPFRHI